MLDNFLNRWSESSRWSRRTIPISSTLDQSECNFFLHFRILTLPFHFACKLVICNEKFLFSWFIITLLQGWRRLHLHVRLCNRRTLLRRLIKMENNQTFGQKIPLGDYLPSLSVPIEMPNYHQENNVNTHVISCKMNVIFNFNISMQENITLKHS